MEEAENSNEIDLTCYPPFWYGFTYVVLSTVFLIITILVAVAIRRHQSYAKWASYQIMFYISLCDIAQLIAQEFAGVSLMFEWEMPDLLNIFVGSIMSGAWISESVYAILLAIHRLLSVVFPLCEMRYFRGRIKTIIFASAHSMAPLFTVSQWTSWSHYIFTLEEFSWDYDKSMPLGNFFSDIDDFSVVPFILCAAICYSIIFYTLKTKVFVYCLFCAFIFILWRFLEPRFDPKPIVYFWTSLPWILYNGANAVLCICFVRSIRGNVLKLLRCRRPCQSGQP